MNFRFMITLLLATQIVIGGGCKGKDEPPAATPAVHHNADKPALLKKLFIESVEPVWVETPLEAIPAWRSAAGAKPALLLLAAEPMLTPVPEEMRAKATALILNGTTDQLLAQGGRPVENPLFFNNMTIDGALRAGLFSRVVWVLPLTKALSLEDFKKQLLDSASITPAEADSLKTIDNKRIEGRIRDIPFVACGMSNIPEIPGPVVLHWEMNYFRDIYIDEIRTPTYNLLGDLVRSLRGLRLAVTTFTLNPDNLDLQTTLFLRPVARDLMEIARKPQVLDQQEMPPQWLLRQQAHYVDLLMQREKATELFAKLTQDYPDDPAAHYGLYYTLRQGKQGAQALAQLDDAVRLDPVYALEYIDLIDLALSRKEAAGAIDMVNRAIKSFPDDPFLKIKKIELYIQLGHGKEILALLTELRKRKWSELYYPDIGEHFDQLEKAARNQPQHP